MQTILTFIERVERCQTWWPSAPSLDPTDPFFLDVERPDVPDVPDGPQPRTDPEVVAGLARRLASMGVRRRTRVHLGANIGPLDAGGHGSSVSRRHHSRHLPNAPR